ncbi:MAG: DUF1080 domain-containing protein [Saprospiraceae bacterium]|nr:DUF1080 domain-containing protein [Saprospiraceae bacterium]
MIKRAYHSIFALLFLASALQAQSALKDLSGTWALTLPNNGNNDAGWMEIKKEDGFIYASVLWYGGSVVPVDHAYTFEDGVILTQTREQETTLGKKLAVTTWYQVSLDGGKLKGIKVEPQVDGMGAKATAFTGVRLPADPPAPDMSSLKYAKPINLLTGNSLNGWELMGEDRTNGWSVENGVLKNNPVQPENGHHVRYGNLRTVDEFEDFNLKLEVNVPKGNNSGVYLRGIYEIQIIDSYGNELDSHNMGALYSRITPSMAAEKPAGEWQSLDMTLVDRHVTVILNGKKIIDNQPVRGCTGGAMTSDEFKPGPIYLQGDHGSVMYRNIVLTPIID